MLTEVRNFKINDVTINYPKLDKPVNPFGAEQYELQIATADEAKVQELEENYGVASSLTAIQITDLVVYAPTGGVDFEAVGSIEPTAEVQGSPSDLF